MKLFFILLLWLIIGAILVSGIVMAVHGSFWLLGLGLLGFAAGITKFGILTH